MDQAALGKKAISEALTNALRAEEFILFAQPIIALDRNAGALPFQEILVRFLEEDNIPLAPRNFIPLLKSRGLMQHLDRWVVARTIRWVRTYCKLIPDGQPPRNSVNIASETLEGGGFGDFVIRKISEHQVSAGALSFEIPMPEAARHADKVDALASKLRPLGCTFAFAAFDGSPDAFDLLIRFHADFVKIGVNLVSACDQDPLVCRTLGSLHRRCRELGVRTIAEHVESQETLEILREIGVDFAQGYHTGLPQPLA